MKYPFFVKSALVACSALALMNCGEDAANIANQVANNADIAGLASSASAAGVTVSEACWVVNADQTYLINTSYIVTDVNGTPVGVYDPATQSITAVNGTPILNSVDLGTLEVKAEGDVIIPVAAASSAATAVLPGASSASVLNPALSSATTTLPATSSPSAALSSATVLPTSSATVPQAASSNSQQQQQQAKSSSSQQQQAQQGTDGTCLDAASGKNVKPYENLSGKNGESYAYKEDCSINCYYDPANANCASIATSNGSNNNNNQQQAKSSSSQQQQQQAKSSSSQQQQQQVQSSSSQQAQGATPNFVIKGQKKSGYATRYWDSCKPHCAWAGKGGPATTPTRTCHADGSLASADEGSACDGGGAGTCLSQIPKIINDNLAYAFAASPGGENDCGRCYLLTFDGRGHDQSPARNQKLKGKQLVIMSSNIGYDVAGGQFDLMIPGGGVGAFSGCSKMGLSCAGERYGGLLATCQNSNNSDDAIISCLKSSCQKEYGNNADALEGCLFMATWMNAADNPTHEYVEIECPADLAARW